MTLALTPLQRFLTGAVLAIFLVSVVLGYEYLANEGRKADLEHRLATLQTTVDKINASAKAGDGSDPYLTTAAFPATPPNLDLATLVLSSASQSGVATGPLGVAAQGTEKVGNNTYRTMTMTLTVSGTLPQVLDFFDRVERGGLHTLVFDNLHLTPADGRWTADVQLTVYAQPG